MSATVIALIVFVVGGLLLAMFVIGIFNNLVTLKNRVGNAFSQIDVQLQRRYDLIPNLVKIAKKYMERDAGGGDRHTQPGPQCGGGSSYIGGVANGSTSSGGRTGHGEISVSWSN
jgi:hypothetical protein